MDGVQLPTSRRHGADILLAQDLKSKVEKSQSDRDMPTQDPLAQPDIAFTPRQVKKWAKSLSLVDLDAASQQALQLISASNRQAYPAKQRFTSMELLQNLAKTFLAHHRRYLACQTFPLSPNANEIFLLQQNLNAEISIAYKIIISEIVQGDAKLDQKKILLCLYRALIH